MIQQSGNFRARLKTEPQIPDDKTGELKPLGRFTAGQVYDVYAVYDAGKFTDFLVSDDAGVFRWIKMSSFEAEEKPGSAAADVTHHFSGSPPSRAHGRARKGVSHA